MFGRIVTALILLFVAAVLGLFACACDPANESKSDKEISEMMDDPTTLPGCLSVVLFLTFGAILLLGLMWFVYGFLGAEPSATPQLPWVLQRG